MVCERFLLVDYINTGHDLPKDLPLEQLRRLQAEIQAEAAQSHRGRSRNGLMDLAWFLLMLHCGLRTAEVRFLRLEDIDWEKRRVRIEQAKGLRDRIVYLSSACVTTLQDYLEVRGPGEALPQTFFVYRHKPLTTSYCGQRLRTYSRRLGIHASPHQLRHSCATLLLNAGAPVLTVQTILGHKWVDTTLGYTRLYDGTVAADYYTAIAEIERRLDLPEDRLSQPPGIGQLLTMVDALRRGTLNVAQIDLVQQLRNGLLLLAEHENRMEIVIRMELRMGAADDILGLMSDGNASGVRSVWASR